MSNDIDDKLPETFHRIAMSCADQCLAFMREHPGTLPQMTVTLKGGYQVQVGIFDGISEQLTPPEDDEVNGS